MTNEYPTFGEKLESIDYQTRIGVYVILTRNNEKEILLIQAPNGAYFLPGGEIELGENHKEAITRELEEETGYKAVVGKYLGRADEYFYSRNRNTYYFHPAHIYKVDEWEQVGERTEEKNHPVWFSVEDGVRALKRGSHKWGVEEWFRQK